MPKNSAGQRVAAMRTRTARRTLLVFVFRAMVATVPTAARAVVRNERRRAAHEGAGATRGPLMGDRLSRDLMRVAAGEEVEGVWEDREDDFQGFDGTA